MRLPEFISKYIIGKYGLDLPAGTTVSSLNEINTLIHHIPLPLLIKPYQPYLFFSQSSIEYSAHSYQEALEISRYLFLNHQGEEAVSNLYLEEQLVESYQINVIIRFSETGEIVISAKKHNDNEQYTEQHINYLEGLTLWKAAEFWEGFIDEEKHIPPLALFSEKCYQIFCKLQLTYLEISDFCIKENRVVIKSLMMDIDDFAIETGQNDIGLDGMSIHLPRRILTTKEKTIKEVNEKESKRGKVKLIDLGFNPSGVAVCFAGTGMALSMMDFLYDHGITPVNITDITPGVSENKAVVLLRTILEDPRVNCLIMVINIFHFSRIDVYASALVTVLKQLNIDPNRFPIVVRLRGQGIEGACEILDSVPGINYYTDEIPFAEIKEILQKTE